MQAALCPQPGGGQPLRRGQGGLCSGGRDLSREEARCRQALLLRRAGEPEVALELFQASCVRRQGRSAYLRTQREWFEIAKREIGA